MRISYDSPGMDADLVLHAWLEEKMSDYPHTVRVEVRYWEFGLLFGSRVSKFALPDARGVSVYRGPVPGVLFVEVDPLWSPKGVTYLRRPYQS